MSLGPARAARLHRPCCPAQDFAALACHAVGPSSHACQPAAPRGGRPTCSSAAMPAVGERRKKRNTTKKPVRATNSWCAADAGCERDKTGKGGLGSWGARARFGCWAGIKGLVGVQAATGGAAGRAGRSSSKSQQRAGGERRTSHKRQNGMCAEGPTCRAPSAQGGAGQGTLALTTAAASSWQAAKSGLRVGSGMERACQGLEGSPNLSRIARTAFRAQI